jgi:hypothetical protein
MSDFNVTAIDAHPRMEYFDLWAFIRAQSEFSYATFGPSTRLKGVCGHIRKELIEVADADAEGKPTLPEWVDVIILALDGAWRSGATPKEITDALTAKLLRNQARTWPDWRSFSPDDSIGHIRAGEEA